MCPEIINGLASNQPLTGDQPVAATMLKNLFLVAQASRLCCERKRSKFYFFYVSERRDCRAAIDFLRLAPRKDSPRTKQKSPYNRMLHGDLKEPSILTVDREKRDKPHYIEFSYYPRRAFD